jgi:hypothetical protein
MVMVDDMNASNPRKYMIFFIARVYYQRYISFYIE